MSVDLNESQSYIWNIRDDEDCLGEGSFGKVYRGVHKKTGDKVAVKTFKHVNHQVSQETKMLQTLQHKHIIRLFAIEVEETSRNIVMIMELCNGGSLMGFLHDPENVCGLPDDEFLLVFKHLSRGLEYLKKHNVIHRDVKPDNIMRHVLDDGSPIYKLADFGAARELPEGQNFYSLHGTEPYLDPQLYKGFFFQADDSIRQFGANTDLWSIGVTLYQTATGSLPFVVRDRHVMLAIYNEMKHNSGIISAFQQKNSEQFQYQKKLPKTCRLSLGLKQLITPIIAGLFIQDSRKQWSFCQYYQQVLEIDSRKVINVFYVNKMQPLKVYIKPEETFDDFKHLVCQQCEVIEGNQVFLYKQNLIVSCFDDFSSLDSDYIFLFDRSNAEVESVSNIELVFDNISNFTANFISGSASDDVHLAMITCRDLSFCKKLTDYQSVVYKCLQMFITDFHTYCKEELKQQRKVHEMLIEKYSDTNKSVMILEELQKINCSTDLAFLEGFQSMSNKLNDQISKLFDDLSNFKAEINYNQLHDSHLKIVAKELLDMKNLIKKLYKARTNKKMYDFEKIKIVHCVRTVMEIFTNKIDPSFEIFVNDIKQWYKSEFFLHVRALSTLKKHMQCYKIELKKFEDEIHFRSEENLRTVAETKQSSFGSEKIIEALMKYKSNNLDLRALVEENLKLVEQMNQMVLALDFSAELQRN